MWSDVKFLLFHPLWYFSRIFGIQVWTSCPSLQSHISQLFTIIDNMSPQLINIFETRKMRNWGKKHWLEFSRGIDSSSGSVQVCSFLTTTVLNRKTLYFSTLLKWREKKGQNTNTFSLSLCNVQWLGTNYTSRNNKRWWERTRKRISLTSAFSPFHLENTNLRDPVTLMKDHNSSIHILFLSSSPH
jgi:hypothetical protein